MRVTLILKIIWGLIPKRLLIEFSLQLLKKVAEKTKTTWDDERVNELLDIYYTIKANSRK